MEASNGLISFTASEATVYGQNVLFFIFLAIFCGCLVRQLGKKIHIPYTPMLLAMGMMIGFFRK